MEARCRRESRPRPTDQVVRATQSPKETKNRLHIDLRPDGQAAEIERLIRRVSQLQHDLPQVSSLELSLVLAGAEGAAVLTARARLDPVVELRSDWFARRLDSHPGDTIPG